MLFLCPLIRIDHTLYLIDIGSCDKDRKSDNSCIYTYGWVWIGYFRDVDIAVFIHVNLWAPLNIYKAHRSTTLAIIRAKPSQTPHRPQPNATSTALDARSYCKH